VRYSFDILFLDKPGDSDKKVCIRKDYRRDITKFIKSSLRESQPEIYDDYYADKKKNLAKPFTFSINFLTSGESKTENGAYSDKLEIVGERCGVHLSFCDFLFAMCLYNAMLQRKERPEIFYNVRHKISNFYPERDFKINNTTVVFKTLSPILVRDLEDKKGRGFIDFNHINFIPNLKNTIKNIAQNHLPDFSFDIDAINIEFGGMKADKINNYGGEIGNSGIIKMTAPVEILNLLYDAGCSAKKSQGFGMLEVVR